MRESIEDDLSKLKKAPVPAIKAIDEDAFIAGIEAADRSALTDEILLPAKAVYDEASDLSNRLRERHKEQQRRKWRFCVDVGSSHGSTIEYRTYPVTFSGVQMNFDFGK